MRTYDPGVDALYIELRAGKPEDSLDIEEGVMADLDAEGHIVGLELLDATERLGAASLATVAIERLPISPAGGG